MAWQVHVAAWALLTAISFVLGLDSAQQVGHHDRVGYEDN
jgi:hypothetical protein